MQEKSSTIGRRPHVAKMPIINKVLPLLAVDPRSRNTTVVSTLRNDAVGARRSRCDRLPHHLALVAKSELRGPLTHHCTVGGARP